MVPKIRTLDPPKMTRYLPTPATAARVSGHPWPVGQSQPPIMVLKCISVLIVHEALRLEALLESAQRANTGLDLIGLLISLQLGCIDTSVLAFCLITGHGISPSSVSTRGRERFVGPLTQAQRTNRGGLEVGFVGAGGWGEWGMGRVCAALRCGAKVTLSVAKRLGLPFRKASSVKKGREEQYVVSQRFAENQKKKKIGSDHSQSTKSSPLFRPSACISFASASAFAFIM